MDSSYTINNTAAAVNPPRPSRLIRLPEVIIRVGLSRSTLYARIKAGTFPAPVKLGEKSVAFLESDIDAWIRDRLAEAGREGTK
jgi:prophage regulatory protein